MIVQNRLNIKKSEKPQHILIEDERNKNLLMPNKMKEDKR